MTNKFAEQSKVPPASKPPQGINEPALSESHSQDADRKRKEPHLRPEK